MSEQSLAIESPRASGIHALTSGAVVSPFPRLRALLGDSPAGIEPVIDMTIGEPRETMPDFLIAKFAEAHDEFAKYPQVRGTDELRGAIADWAGRRYGIELDAAREIVPVNGSREGLYYAIIPAVGRRPDLADKRPAVLMPNPFYQPYAGAALSANCEPVYMAATRGNDFLPDLDAVAADEALLARTVAMFVCSPANPQGTIADEAYLARALELARRHDFILFADECYSEIYDNEPPPGALAVAAKTPERFANLIVHNSLSKRSNLPGLRSGFCAGDAAFLDTLVQVRNLIGPQVPQPTQHVSAAVWADERHVETNRAAYSAKFDVADEVLGDQFGYARPDAGFFLWLDMTHFGGGVNATVTLWKDCGVKVVPGAYLAQDGADGRNPGQEYVRVALVHDVDTVRDALTRIVRSAVL